MAEFGQLAGPVMRAAARLHANPTAWQVGEELEQLAAPQPLAQHDLPARVGAVDLEAALCDVEPDRGNLHVDVSRVRGSLHASTLARRCRQREASMSLSRSARRW